MQNFSYLHLGEKINKEKNIIATFRVESSLLLTKTDEE